MADLVIAIKENSKFLVSGGGERARNIVALMLKFTRNLYVISSFISEDFAKYLSQERIPFQKEKLKRKHFSKADYIIACDEVEEVNFKTGKLSIKKKKPLWWLGRYEYSTYYVPAILKMDDLIIGISSSGISLELEKVMHDALKKLIDLKVTGLLRRIKSKEEYYNSRVKPEFRKDFWVELLTYAYDNISVPKSFEKEAGRLFVKYSKM